MSWVAVAMGVGSLAAGAYSSSQQSKAAGKANKMNYKQGLMQRQWALDDYKKLMEDWKKNAFPNQGAMNAERWSAQSALGQAYKGVGNKIFSQSASRGFGPGSGLTMKSLGDTQGSYMNALGQMYANLAKFGNTPQWSAPSSIGQTGMQPVATQPAGGGMAQASDMMGTTAGILLWNQLANGGGGNQSPFATYPSTVTGSPSFGTSYGAQFGVANPKYGW